MLRQLSMQDPWPRNLASHFKLPLQAAMATVAWDLKWLAVSFKHLKHCRLENIFAEQNLYLCTDVIIASQA